MTGMRGLQGMRKRGLRSGAAALAVCGLLLTACSSNTGHPPATGDTPGTPQSTAGDSVQGAAVSPALLKPLPVAVPPSLQPYYQQKLTWKACDGSFECATMKVPLDYDHPGTGDLSIAVARERATGPDSSRLGSLLLNPGGPGASAIEYLEAVAGTYAAPVRADYDLVGMDPRGVGDSSPVECLSGPQMDAYAATDTTPDNQAEIDRLVMMDKEFAAACEQHSARTLPHVDTVESARDMDVLRSLLGDEKLHYVGKSYGTYLGAVYAGLYPSRVGRMVLDGALDPTLGSVQANIAQAAGFEVAWSAFASDCVDGDGCPLGGSVEEAGRKLDALLLSLDRTPLPTGGPRRLTESLATMGVIQAMYADFLWPQLRTALKDAQQGNGAGLLALADQYYERESDGSYSNLMYANLAVNCLDAPPPFSTPEQAQAAVKQFTRTSPHFGRIMAWMSLACAYWPVKPTGQPHTVRASGAAPIVVVGTTRDPATPYGWAKSLATQLSSGRLLTYQGDGHTAYGGESDCIDSAVNRYLLEGQAPPREGQVCSS